MPRLVPWLVPWLAALALSGCTPQKQGDPPPKQGPEYDVTTAVEADPLLVLGAQARVGWHATLQIRAGGQTFTSSLAIVGQTDDAWQVERVDFMTSAMAPGMILGLTVRKADGAVTAAVIGKPGEEGKPVRVRQPVPAPPLTVTDEDAKLALGTFPARKHAAPDGAYWIGRGGDMNGVLLKVEGARGDYELERQPLDTQLRVGETPVEVTEYTYGDGRVLWFASGQPLLAALDEEGRPLAKMVTGDTTRELVELGRDAKPRLKW